MQLARRDDLTENSGMVMVISYYLFWLVIGILYFT